MKFGKLKDVNGIDFSLPDDHPDSIKLFEKFTLQKRSPKIYIGTTGWSNPMWKGLYYPAKAKADTFLNHYATMFNSIEMNTTHYRIPDEKTVEKWKSKVGSNFKFAPKIPQSISHRGNLQEKKELLNRFNKTIQRMDENLGICFIQLPDSLSIENRGNLKHFLENLPSHIPYAVELRNQTWFLEKNNFNAFFHFFELHNITPVFSDVAGRRDVLHMRLSTDKVIIRFVGNGLHSSDFQRLDSWADRLQNWISKGLNEVYFFIHQPNLLQVPETVNYFIDSFNKHTETLGMQQIPKIKSQNTQLELF